MVSKFFNVVFYLLFLYYWCYLDFFLNKYVAVVEILPNKSHCSIVLSPQIIIIEKVFRGFLNGVFTSNDIKT